MQFLPIHSLKRLVAGVCVATTLLLNGCNKPAPTKTETPQAFEAIPSSTPPAGIPEFVLVKRPEVTRTRFAKVNMAMFERKGSSDGPDSSLTLNLFEGEELTLKMESVAQNSDSVFSWYGRVDTTLMSFAHVVVSKTGVYVMTQVNSTVFEVLPFKGGIVQINEVDQSKFSEGDDVANIPGVSGGSDEVDPGYTPVSDLTILVLATPPLHYLCEEVAYEAAFEDNLNYAFNNIQPTGVHAEVILACIPFNETGDLHDDLDNLIASPLVSDMRQLSHGDVVCLLVSQSTDGRAGTALMPVLPHNMADASSAFCVVKNNPALSGYVFAHEVGHTMGMDHDRITATAQGQPRCNFGSIFKARHPSFNAAFTFRSIMAYGAACDNCPRLPVFSSPLSFSENGWVVGPMGKACGASPTGNMEPADNRNQLIIGAPIVTLYR